jgi:hypothetical protein
MVISPSTANKTRSPHLRSLRAGFFINTYRLIFARRFFTAAGIFARASADLVGWNQS